MLCGCTKAMTPASLKSLRGSERLSVFRACLTSWDCGTQYAQSAGFSTQFTPKVDIYPTRPRCRMCRSCDTPYRLTSGEPSFARTLCTNRRGPVKTSNKFGSPEFTQTWEAVTPKLRVDW